MKLSLTRTMAIVLATSLALAACAADQAARRARAESLRDLGEAYLVDGNSRAALRELLQAVEIDRQDPVTHNLLGLAYQSSDHLDLAGEHFSEALRLKPDFSQARNNLAVVLLRQEKWEAAIGHLQQLTEDLLYPTPHYAAANLAWAYYKLERFGPARQMYQRTLDHYRDGFPKDLTYIRALLGLGRVALATGQAAEALEHLQTAAGLAPSRPEIQFALGQAYAAVGDTANARHAFGKVRELAPESDLARKSQATGF